MLVKHKFEELLSSIALWAKSDIHPRFIRANQWPLHRVSSIVRFDSERVASTKWDAIDVVKATEIEALSKKQEVQSAYE